MYEMLTKKSGLDTTDNNQEAKGTENVSRKYESVKESLKVKKKQNKQTNRRTKGGNESIGK